MGRLIPRYLWGVNRFFEDGLGQRVSPLMSPFARAKPKVRPFMIGYAYLPLFCFANTGVKEITLCC